VVSFINSSDFLSQEQNRDLWSQPLAKDIVKSNFIFMQLGIENSDGQDFLRKFPCPIVQKSCYIAIIDPQTEVRKAAWDTSLTGEDFTTRGKFTSLSIFFLSFFLSFFFFLSKRGADSKLVFCSSSHRVS